MGDLFLLRGLPNAGKSTVANHLAPGAVFAADDYFEEDGKYVFDHSRLPEAHDSCRKNVIQAMFSGIKKIAVANTFVTIDEIEPYLQLGSTHGYRVHIMIIEKQHQGNNEHDVPQSSVDVMVKQFEWVDPRFHSFHSP